MLRTVYQRSPASLFIEKAQQVRSETKISGPPFSPFECAAALGISVEETDDLTLDGLLKVDSDGHFVVHLKRNANKCRKNFTLAHEIAHTFFYDLLTHPMSYRGSLDFDPEEERLCDMAAAELLMPSHILKSDIANEPTITPETLFYLRKRYQVSLQALAIRLVNVAGNLAYSTWKRQGSSVDLEWITPRWLKHFKLCLTGKSSIERALEVHGEVFTSIDSFYGGRKMGRTMAMTSSFGLRSDQVIAVINLPKNLTKRPQ